MSSHTFDAYNAMLDLFGPPPLLVNGTILTLEHVMQRLEIIASVDFGIRSGKILSWGCPRHPKVKFKDNQKPKLGDAPEGIPSFVFIYR